MPEDGAVQLERVAERLFQAGTQGQGLRRELVKAVNAAAEPLAKEISSLDHLIPYLPDRYAGILHRDLSVAAKKSFTADPQVSLVAKARERKQKVVLLDRGIINHPVWARGARRTWRWSNSQTGGMKAGFFSDVADRHGPQIRARVMRALTETERQITS